MWMQKTSRYHKGIEKGMIKVDAKPEIVFETPVSASNWWVLRNGTIN